MHPHPHMLLVLTTLVAPEHSVCCSDCHTIPCEFKIGVSVLTTVHAVPAGLLHLHVKLQADVRKAAVTEVLGRSTARERAVSHFVVPERLLTIVSVNKILSRHVAQPASPGRSSC